MITEELKFVSYPYHLISIRIKIEFSNMILKSTDIKHFNVIHPLSTMYVKTDLEQASQTTKNKMMTWNVKNQTLEKVIIRQSRQNLLYNRTGAECSKYRTTRCSKKKTTLTFVRKLKLLNWQIWSYIFRIFDTFIG